MSVIDYAGHFQKTLPHTIAESTINLVVSLIGAYYLGIYGVLLGTVISLLYRTNQVFLYSNKKILGRSTKRTYSIYLLNIVLFALTQLIFKYLFGSYVISSYVKFACVGVGCALVALLVMFLGHFLLLPHCRCWAISTLKRKKS